MSWLNDQIQASLKPTHQQLDRTSDLTSSIASNASSMLQNIQDKQSSQNSQLGGVYTRAGEAAMNAYLDALGIAYQTSPGKAAVTSAGTWKDANGNPVTSGTYNLNGTQVNISPEQIATLQAGGSVSGRSSPQTTWATNAQGLGWSNQYTTPEVAPTYSTPSSASDILSRFMNSPGYQAMFKEGLSSVNSKAAANGLLGSGAQAKGLVKYASDYAQRGYQQYLGNFMNAAQLGQDTVKNIMNQNTSLATSNMQNQTSLANNNLQAQKDIGMAKARLLAGNRSIPGLMAIVGQGASSF